MWLGGAEWAGLGRGMGRLGVASRRWAGHGRVGRGWVEQGRGVGAGRMRWAVGGLSEAGQSGARSRPHLQDLAAVRQAVHVITRLVHTERHAVQQDHQHADAFKPRAQ